MVAEINRQLQLIDSIRTTGDGELALNKALELHDKYRSTPNPFMAFYYRMREDMARDNDFLMNAYADSALNVFNDKDIARLYPLEHFRAILYKSEACRVNKKYNLALQYYYTAQGMAEIDECNRYELYSRIAGIYYDQENYRLAGRNWYRGYLMLKNCTAELPEKVFGMQQGVLDNAGLAYQRAGDLDSAAFCFFTDIQLVNNADTAKILRHNLIPARLVVYDNIGGLYMQRNMHDSAEYYLQQCIAINHTDLDGITIPIKLKLAELYTIKGDNNKAVEAFDKSKVLLQKFGKYNPESLVKWHKLYAAFLLKNNRAVEGYNELAEYIRMRDSLTKENNAVLTLNVGREFNTLQQQHTLEELKIKDQVNNLYLWSIATVVVLSVVIIILVYRNLKKARKTHSDTMVYNQELQKTLQQLEAANKNYIRIMRVMAHDLRNPLGGITGIAGMVLKTETLSDDAKHMLQLIETTGNHSMEMINELLKSGLAADNELMAVEKLDLVNLLYNTVELLQFKANEKQQSLIFESDSAIIEANINQEKMWRVFNNIIVNAIKFTPDNGTISVSIKQKNRKALITIADNGIGIPDKDKEQVFDMFTAAKRPGTNGEKPFGLGLSISKTIMKMHNGQIWLESTEGQGTTFFIELSSY